MESTDKSTSISEDRNIKELNDETIDYIRKLWRVNSFIQQIEATIIYSKISENRLIDTTSRLNGFEPKIFSSKKWVSIYPHLPRFTRFSVSNQ